jgi:hypothetical protein
MSGTRLAASGALLALAFCFGCGNDSTPRPKFPTGPTPSLTLTLRDIDYTTGIYYFLYDPNLDHLQINNFEIEVYLDDYNSTNDQNTIPGRAFMDAGLTTGPTGTYGDPAVSDTTSARGIFSVLYPGADVDYEILEMYGPDYKVLRLKRQITGEQVLAVTYRAQRVGGGTVEVGGQNTVESDGVTRRYMKLLRPPSSRVNPDPSGFYSRDSLFALTRDLELKNIYQFPGQHFDPTTFELTIRKGVDDPPVTSIPTPNGGVPYLEVVGLDSYDESSGTPVPGHDGKVDLIDFAPGSPLVDFENGILFFPDPRPFAPRIGSPGGAPLFPFDQAVSNMLVRRDSLVGAPGTANGANVAIYDKYNAMRSFDVAYWIDARVPLASFTSSREGAR